MLQQLKDLTASVKPVIKVDVVSDVVCPWCYIGKRRIENAIDQISDKYTVNLSYLPYELNPDMLPEGVNQKEYLAEKFGSEDRYQQITQHTTQVAAQEGLQFDFDKQNISPNTRKAHAIIQAAKAEGKQLEVMEAFFKAFFTEGKDLSKNENLIRIAVDAGMTESIVTSVLRDENTLLEVAAVEMQMQKLGITGVPFYIINDRYAISGAQSSETFVKALEEIGLEANPEAGASCTVDGKC